MAHIRTHRGRRQPQPPRTLGGGARLVMVTLFCVFFAAPLCRAQLADTPWPTFHHDSQRTGRSPYLGPETAALKWRFRLANFSQSSIAIGEDDTIYCGDDGGIVYAINPDGSEKWRVQTDSTFIRSSGPAINVDGTIYVGATIYPDRDRSGGVLYAFNPDGSEKWRVHTGEYGHIYGSPTIGEDGIVYFGSRDRYLYAVSPQGEVRWRFPASYIAATPSIGHDGRIYAATYVGNPNLLHCVNAKGQEDWQDRTGSDTFVGCAIADDGVIYTQTYNELLAHNPDGILRWRIRNYNGFGAPCIGHDGTIYTIGRDGLMAVSPAGDILWTADPIAGGPSPIVDAEGTIYAGPWAYRSDGSFKWIFREGQHYYTRPAMGRDGTLYIIGDTWLYAIGPGRGKPGPLLALTGDCPGRIEASVTRATPDGRIALSLSAPEGCGGQTTIPSGPCAGTVLPIGGARLVCVLIADGEGTARLAGNVPGGACGGRCLVALDVTTCKPSNAVGF